MDLKCSIWFVRFASFALDIFLPLFEGVCWQDMFWFLLRPVYPLDKICVLFRLGSSFSVLCVAGVAVAREGPRKQRRVMCNCLA